MVVLRDILPAGWARGLQVGGVADRPLDTDTMASFERLQLIWCQIEANTLFVRILVELGLSATDATPASLHEAIGILEMNQIICRKDAGIFRALNRAANSAKHDMLQARL